MRKVRFLTVTIILVLVSAIFSGCGVDKREKLNVFNCYDYINEDVIKSFEKQYNINVIYSNYDTNEDMYVKLAKGGGDYDVVFPSDYMIKRMIDEGLVEKIDLNNIPNYKYIDQRFKNLEYDPNNEYSVPYMWGTVGILYNKKMVSDPVNSWNILWNKKYSGQILMLDSQRDSIGITLKMLGYSLNTNNVSELEEAKKKLIEQRPLVMSYVVDDGKDKMIGDEAALAVVWSGDAFYSMKENKDLDYVIPKEGSNLWFDGMVIPKGSKHKDAAEKFINYMCDPEMAYKNADFIGYSTPETEAKKKLAPEIINNKSAYPDEKDVANCEIFKSLGSMLPEYDRIWTEVKSK